MSITTTKLASSQLASETAVYLFDDWFDPIEAGVRDRVREFIQAMGEGELGSALMRPRYGRRPKSLSDAPSAAVIDRHLERIKSCLITSSRSEIKTRLIPARLDESLR